MGKLRKNVKTTFKKRTKRVKNSLTGAITAQK